MEKPALQSVNKTNESARQPEAATPNIELLLLRSDKEWSMKNQNPTLSLVLSTCDCAAYYEDSAATVKHYTVLPTTWGSGLKNPLTPTIMIRQCSRTSPACWLASIPTEHLAVRRLVSRASSHLDRLATPVNAAPTVLLIRLRTNLRERYLHKATNLL